MFLPTDNGGTTVFNVGGMSYIEGVFQEIMKCAENNLTREEVNKLFVATDNEGRTVLHVVAGSDKTGLFQEILKCAKRI